MELTIPNIPLDVPFSTIEAYIYTIIFLRLLAQTTALQQTFTLFHSGGLSHSY